ncbi:carboxymuconolactone decarboxylase family protein [Saprospiraceae bacterium]|jgi:AhpD family alkylhydroperoxidase|nr:carboxymuconolactone decarboxylase family protein [Bacteroidota bacterium]MDB4728171.1 carboxymuconolactone decarboxylase family protein [Saprospiraceae bacterium]MDF1868056.1 carboxymuconolactone decarboxylase family protein [Saprospiraceae bacterium]
MKALKSLTTEQASAHTKEIFSVIKQKVGRVPNLYAAMGNSPQLLGGFLAFEGSLKSGTFSAKENEAIALAVSQTNGYNYCLAAHSAMGKMAGFSENEIIDIRRGTSTDSKLNALTTLATELTAKRGKASQEAIDNFLDVGYTPQSFAELIGLVAIRSIINYIYSNGDFEIDFPKAATLEELVAA